jgi:hypothetical protein
MTHAVGSELNDGLGSRAGIAVAEGCGAMRQRRKVAACISSMHRP